MKKQTKLLNLMLAILLAPFVANAATFSYTVPNPSPTSSYGEFINFCTVDMNNTAAPLSNCWYYLVNPAFNTPFDSPFYAILNPVATPTPTPTPGTAVPPVIYATFPNGTVGAQYGQGINVILESTASTATIMFTGLPAGLSFNGVDYVSGIPTAPGTYSVTIDAVDNTNGTVSTVTVPLVIADAPVPQDILCSSQASGLPEVISTISPQGGWLSTLTAPLLVKYPNQANTVLQPGMVTFSVGDSVTYNGVVDQSGVFCVASTMTVYAAPTPTPTPTPVVACPVSGVKVGSKSKVLSIAASSFSTISGKTVNFLPCTRFTKSTLKVGDSVEWKGFMVNGSIVANKVAVN